jgi:hypothetical protein
MTTPYEDWKHYLAKVHGPAIYKEAVFYWMIGAALQRRVWLGGAGGNFAVFPNQYLLLVGNAGVGKSLIMDPAAALLSAHVKPNSAIDMLENGADAFTSIFPSGPDSTSYEAFVARMTKSIDSVKFKKQDGSSGIYAHCSMWVSLDEYTSLFKKHADDTVTFFLTVWSAAKYERETIARKKEKIINPCLSMLAGTTPDNLRKLTNIDIVGTGLARRTMMVYAPRNEWEQLMIPALDDEQVHAKQRLHNHIRTLKDHYGSVSYTDEALAMLTSWWEGGKRRFNRAPVCDDYENNLTMHVHKIALAIHYGQYEIEDKISIETARKALDFVRRTCLTRHHCFEKVGRNDLHPVATRVVKYITENGEQPYGALLAEFHGEVNLHEMQHILSALLAMGVITQTNDTLAGPIIGLASKQRKELVI